ncbi:YeiH family protein [Rhizobium sp. TRM95796]|uniref:YeiH family protein n=1 Tax=Rhizobium sp. TRM95796 TaxID=2979862 RepID=UPI0021E986BD|nr:putative sulfate exporter family transporter [Rhizobium sp. TRM95796]MCV3768599.1 putative sulfate exporter family transporter [Rhizobium sp. TRM95796]
MLSIAHKTSLLPGAGLCVTLAVTSLAAEHLFPQARAFGLDPMMLAMLAGVVLRSAGLPLAGFDAGIRAMARRPLEIAIAAMGATISAATIASMGATLPLVVFAAVAASIAASYAAGRMLGLEPRLAALVASGNSICGNSAIMAVGPAIGAKADETSRAIAFTASLSILVIAALPAFGSALGFDALHFGVFAGMTVYAVPQVLAATSFMGPVSAEIGAVVKLVRVLTLGPVLMILGRFFAVEGAKPASLSRIAPWYILGFFVMMAFNLAGALPEQAVTLCRFTAAVLPVVAMAALGLSVDLRELARSGGRIAAAGVVSALMLIAISAVVALVVVRA